MLREVRDRQDVQAPSLYPTPSLCAGLAYRRATPLFRSPSHPAPLSSSSDVRALLLSLGEEARAHFSQMHWSVLYVHHHIGLVRWPVLSQALFAHSVLLP